MGNGDVIGTYQGKPVHWDGKCCLWRNGDIGWVLQVDTKEKAIEILNRIDGFKELKED